MRRAPTHREVGWDGTAVTAHVRRTGDATLDLLAVLAEAATDLLTDPAVGHIRTCEGPGCRLLILATNPRRRWCSRRCAATGRVARHHRRHRPEPH
jgi:predicted RNA-binding Zn ribbon-like protein